MNKLLKPAICAEVHTDDFNAEASFDAAPWFAQASDKAILELADCGWGGNYAADAVAEWFADLKKNAEVVDVFDYLRAHNRMARHRRSAIGFECHVNENDALGWLHQHRPAIAKQIESRWPYAAR